MSKRRETYLLPDGEATADVDAYIAAWRALAEPIEQELGWCRYAYDPDLAFQTGSGKSVHVPVDLAAAFRRIRQERDGLLIALDKAWAARPTGEPEGERDA